MPKTKKQKQEEALLRLRKGLEPLRHQMLRELAGGDIYNFNVRTYGTSNANRTAKASLKDFKRKCEVAGVDTRGNPLS